MKARVRLRLRLRLRLRARLRLRVGGLAFARVGLVHKDEWLALLNGRANFTHAIAAEEVAAAEEDEDNRRALNVLLECTYVLEVLDTGHVQGSKQRPLSGVMSGVQGTGHMVRLSGETSRAGRREQLAGRACRVQGTGYRVRLSGETRAAGQSCVRGPAGRRGCRVQGTGCGRAGSRLGIVGL